MPGHCRVCGNAAGTCCCNRNNCSAVRKPKAKDNVFPLERAHIRAKDPLVYVAFVSQGWSDRYDLGGAGYYALESTETVGTFRYVNRKPFRTKEAAERWAKPLNLPKPKSRKKS